MNLTEILKGHEGETFYSQSHGYVKFKGLEPYGGYYGVIKASHIDRVGYERFEYFLPDGRLSEYGEIMLFPSKDQHDWEVWKRSQKSPKEWETLRSLLSPDELRIIDSYEDNTRTIIERSALASIKIYYLIEYGYGGIVTKDEWLTPGIKKWTISFSGDGVELVVDWEKSILAYTLVAFHTEDQAIEFLSCWENIELLKAYYMI